MSSTVEKNFSWFVKKVIGVTGLDAIGSIDAGGSLLKCFSKGVKAVKKAWNDPDENSAGRAEFNRTPDNTDAPTDAPEGETTAESEES